MGVRFWVLPAILSAKCLIAWVFFENIIFDQPDAQAFYGEGEVLFEVYEQNPDDYYTLLTGSDETKAIIDKYLSNTFHWNQGPQGVFNDNKNIIRVHSLIRFISMDMPAIHLMVFCLISLVGCCVLFLGIKDRTQLGPITVLLIVFFFPTCLLYTSPSPRD